MYISKIEIENFRCFRTAEIEFNPGMNVIIGSNNAGKTTVIKALELIFNRNNTRSTLSLDDFNKSISDLSEPPEITITATLCSSENNTEDDKAVVASWLTKLDSPWEAKLTYKFFLPEKNAERYREEISQVYEENRWEILEKYFPMYVSRILGGNPDNNLRADVEYLDKIHCETLNALRDVDSHMASGRNSLLKQILLHFKDYGIEKDSDEIRFEKNQKAKEEFHSSTKKVVSNIVDRIQTEEILKLAKETGAIIGGSPGLKGRLEEADVLSILNLIIRTHTNIEVPISNNGMGYNNLIYISLILAKFKMITSKNQGENAKVFPVLLIEEPEAHLHPSLQYNFLKFLKEEVDKQEHSRQIFITTHSTQITSAVGLDPIICLEADNDAKVQAKYPARVFSNSKDDQKSKRYVERFLDATKSAMLFSQSVLFVEGMAELMLYPVLAEKCRFDLDRSHVSLIKVDSSTFKHFIKLFGANVEEECIIYALNKNVACVTDADPIKKNELITKGKGSGWNACWPFEIGSQETFKYNNISNNLKSLIGLIGDYERVKVFYNDSGYGKTLEYDLAWENSETDFFKENVKELEEFDELINSNWTAEEQEKAKVASGFLQYAEGKKGELAFELADILKPIGSPIICVPQYIVDAFKWVCFKREDEVQ
ncbi:ATP-dependent nuclease [Oceanobacillus massiliensis]|uniref:ATP-dependent nuclease n=1 Tax=Oceanobacillus massiliensis TaxID=1465765 RepID=UPI00028A40A0|nr:AAA family ATPase [Oceanobacillus massiliensis]